MKKFSTLCELVSFQASNFNNPRLLNFSENGEEKFFSSQEFFEKILYFACALKEIGIKKGESFVNFSYQNPYWLIADLGAILAGATTVPIFANISKENLLYEIFDADAKFIFTDEQKFFEMILDENFQPKIITRGFTEKNSLSFEALILLGKKAFEEKKYSFEKLAREISEQDLATIIYTSGSTGKPKGVELTHANLVSQILATEKFFPLKAAQDVALSYLPLAHIFERMVMMFYISQGISICFTDEVKRLGELLKSVHPTLMTTVPRLLEKVFAKIEEGIEAASFVKKFLGRKALKRALTKDPSTRKNFCDLVYDAVIYKKFRVALGGRMRMIICGGSALAQDLERFYNNIGVDLFCGYGMTETSPVLAANCFAAHKIGSVGKSFPQVELKIAADHELLARTPGLMRGYHNHPEKTAEVIENGWFKTGDLAQIDEQGFVKIIGRKKELFKNANGKYVAPVPLEQKLVQDLGFLLGALVIAEGKKFTAALLFPDFEILKKFKEKFSFHESDEEFLRSQILQNFVQEKLNKLNKNFDHWEQIQKFHIALQPISIESGEITPSMKLKRNLLEEKFKKEIDGFYKE